MSPPRPASSRIVIRVPAHAARLMLASLRAVIPCLPESLRGYVAAATVEGAS